MSFDQYLGTFITQARELLESMEADLLKIEGSDDSPDTINSVFRAAHTIKSSAGMLSLDAIGSFTHVVESLLDRLRSGALAPSPAQASPVTNEAGQRMGTAVEWMDLTAEIRVQEEINRIVQAAAAGHLSQRLSLDDKQGFMRNLAEGVNHLTSGVQDIVEAVLHVAESLPSGDLNQSINAECRAP